MLPTEKLIQLLETPQSALLMPYRSYIRTQTFVSLGPWGLLMGKPYRGFTAMPLDTLIEQIIDAHPQGHGLRQGRRRGGAGSGLHVTQDNSWYRTNLHGERITV